MISRKNMLKKGTIILVPFPFTDLSEKKVRPAVVLSDDLKGEDVVVAFISSQKPKKLQLMDIAIAHSDEAFSKTGLKTDSIIKIGKIATLDKKVILGELGRIHKNTEREIAEKIKILFGLSVI